MKRTSLSAGIVAFKYFEGVKKYLFVKRGDGLLAWPSGHQESGETIDKTAIREALEETDFAVELICFLPIKISERENKISVRVVFLAELKERISEGEHEVVWLTPSEILSAFYAGGMFRWTWQLEAYEDTNVQPLKNLQHAISQLEF